MLYRQYKLQTEWTGRPNNPHNKKTPAKIAVRGVSAGVGES